MNILAIESSCDETSAAILSGDKLASSLISSQDFHKTYGGVVPELSSRAHIQIVAPLVRKALKDASLDLKDIDLIAATAGPGLIGALLVGLTYAKGLSFSLKKPFLAVNHIEGHIFSGFLEKQVPEFPFLALVVSGGHTLLLRVEGFTTVKKLGSTVDDAAGEAFDKVSKMIGLGYPGGPMIQKFAAQGDPDKIRFPVADLKNPFDFSFSGLKTAVLRYLQKTYGEKLSVPENDLADIAASFQKAAVTALTRSTEKAIKNYEFRSITVAGGVAANVALRSEMKRIAAKYNLKLVIPGVEFCGDNAAMIAIRAKQLYDAGIRSSLNAAPFPGLPGNYFS